MRLNGRARNDLNFSRPTQAFDTYQNDEAVAQVLHQRTGAHLDAQALELLDRGLLEWLGERAEDVFFVTTDDDRPLDEAASQRLVSSLEATLADPEAA